MSYAHFIVVRVGFNCFIGVVITLNYQYTQKQLSARTRTSEARSLLAQVLCHMVGSTSPTHISHRHSSPSKGHDSSLIRANSHRLWKHPRRRNRPRQQVLKLFIAVVASLVDSALRPCRRPGIMRVGNDNLFEISSSEMFLAYSPIGT
jgi:hypothetical protein